MPLVHYQYALQRLWRRLYNLHRNHPEEYIIIYKDDLVSAFRRLCYHPDVAAAYTFVLSAYLVILLGMVFGSRHYPSLFCLLSDLRSFASLFVHHIHLSHHTILIINRVRFPHTPPSSRYINLDHTDPINQVVYGTNLVPHPTFFDDTIMAEVRSFIRQSAGNIVLAASVFIGNSNLVK